MVHHPDDKNHQKTKPPRDGWLRYVPLFGVLLGFVRLIVELARH